MREYLVNFTFSSFFYIIIVLLCRIGDEFILIKLMKYLKSGLICAILAPLFMILEVAMDLMQPNLMSEIVNKGIANGNLDYVLSTGGKMIGAAFLGLIGGSMCTFFSSVASARYGRDLRSAVFKKVQSFSFGELDKLKTSSLITRITNDITQVQQTVLMMLRIMVRAPFTVIGGIIMAFTVSPSLSVIFLIAMPLLLILIFFVVRKAFPLFMQMQNKIDRVNTVMRENLLGVKVVKAFVGYKTEEKRFKTANEDLMNTSIRATKITMLMWPFVNFIINASTIAVLWFGGSLHLEDKILVGDIMAFLNYLTQILMSLTMVIMTLMILSRAQASAKRINEIFDTEPSITNPPLPKNPDGIDIEFENVYFSYNNDENYVLKNISFTAKHGQTIGIIGGTGSGKSSLISLISRLYDVTKGKITLGGVDIREISGEVLHSKIGTVLQESILFEGTVRDNLKYGNKNATDEQLYEAIKAACADEFIKADESGLNKPVEQRGRNFSGGQKQRLSIARTFVKNPDILILDDSTSALDLATEAKIRGELSQRNKNGIMFIIAQRISAIMNADKILVLDDGEIVGMGTHEELKQNNEIYRSIVISQFGEEAV